MKQVLQQAGEIFVKDVPAPKLLPGCVLVRIAASLVSAGTERAAAEFAGKNIFHKAKARPDLVRDVISKVRRDGFLAAVSAVRSRLDQPTALGYSSSGTVISVGAGVTDVSVGDRVACAGAGYAVHAEFACVPRLLVAKIPPDSPVTCEEAAFTTIGAVALHGIRNADAKLGDVVAVIGLGLLGQLTVQLLKAAGCRVLGMDLNEERVDLALRLGADAVTASAEEMPDQCLRLSGGHGADSVLITAETVSSDPVNLAATIARDRAVVVAIGTVGLELQRKPYYEKELDFRVSRSYGPGRYDSAYEQKGRDYPIGHVRWTETRNMEAFLQFLSAGIVNVRSLTTHRIPIRRAQDAYDLIRGERKESFLGVLITYPELPDERHEIQLLRKEKASLRAGDEFVNIGVLGAGSFAVGALLPALQRTAGINLIGVCAANGSTARYAAEKFDFEYSATEEQKILNDANINAIVIATRHHLHAPQVLAAIAAGKHIFCEKPLCLSEPELAEIVRAYESQPTNRILMVGFNRRFAPLAGRMKLFLKDIQQPMVMHYRVNAGFLPSDHWVNDEDQGGGRILGEVCHFIDLLTFLAGSPVIEVQTRAVPEAAHQGGDNSVMALRFADGSQATITYVVGGDRAYSKERLEVFGGGSVAVLEDFRTLELVRHGRKRIFRSWFRQDKGHRAELESFVAAVKNGAQSPIPWADIVAVTLATLRAKDSQSLGQALGVDVREFTRNMSLSRPASTS